MVDMKRNNLYAFGSLAVLAWVAMTYFLLVHRPNNNLEDIRRSRIGALEDKLQEVEVKLKTSLDENSLFLNIVRNMTKQKVQSSSKTSTFNSNNNSKEADLKPDVIKRNRYAF